MGSAGPEAEGDDQVEFPRRLAAHQQQLLVPDEFRCPISGQVMADPVIVSSGQSYERSCIQAWLDEGRGHCYKTQTPLDHHLLIPNVGLRTAILGWSAAFGSPKPQPVAPSRAADLVRDLLRVKRSTTAEDELGKSFAAAEAATAPSPIRYVHSASGATLRELSDAPAARITVPHPLDTSPSSLTGLDKHQEQGGAAMEPGVIQQLIKKLRRGSEQESAAEEIRRLAREGPLNRRALADPGLLEALVGLFQSSRLQVNCVTAILNLSLETDNKLKIVRAGATPHLIRALKFSQPEVQELAAGAIFSLAQHEENRLAIGVLGAIPPLIELLRSTRHSRAAQVDAAMALYCLSLAQLNRGKMIKAGLIPILISGAERPDFRDLASRGLCILSCLASTSEGRTALLEINGVARLLNLLESKGEPESESEVEAEFREHAVAALLQLSHHNIRFKHLAFQAGAVEILLSLLESGSATRRAKEKIQTLLTILKESPASPGSSSSSIDPYFPRSYVRTATALAARRGDFKAESSHF